MFNVKEFQWSPKPLPSTIETDCITITTMPKTDLWQKTFGGFSADNAPVLQKKTSEKFFSFGVKASFTGNAQYDQCGIILYMNSDTWLKVSIECENDQIKHLGSVATNHGYSDWATTAVPASVTDMWYRLTRKGSDFLIECSEDGKQYSLMRMLHMFDLEDEVNFGIYACSPGESSFTAVFTDFHFSVLSEGQMKL